MMVSKSKSMIHTEQYTSAGLFLDVVHEYLLQREAENNLMLGVLHKCMDNLPNSNHIFIATQKHGQTVFAVVQTQHHFIIAGEKMYSDVVIDFIVDQEIVVSGIIGQKELCLHFASRWKAKTKKSWLIKMNQRIYQLNSLRSIAKSPGHLRLATSADQKILRRWMQEFAEVLGEQIDEEKSRIIVDNYLSDASLYVWVDQQIVSMARKARPSDHGIVVTSVFTPVEYRNQGYATSLVHDLSALLLQDYKFCALYTDLDNPTSNRVYQRIGYRPIADSIVIQFSDR